ncbi:MAG TPA: LysR family transcriptional regulator [bacterium]|nr:LysR family transcriptional regulator [bacterium]
MILDKKMRVFLATAEAGSFSRAARQLSLSQSVVSFHIKALEQELGVSLFRRQGRSISLTAEGKLLFEEGHKLAREARRIEDVFSAQSEEIAQRIYIAGDALTCAFTLPWTLAAFREDYPDVLFTYEHLEETELIDRLVSGELDVALAGHQVQHRKLTATPCFQDTIVLVGPAKTAPDSITVDELRETPLLWATSDRGLELLLSKNLPEAGLPLKDLNVFMEVDNLPILKTFVRAGVGMSFLPYLTVSDEVRFGILKTVDVPGLTLERTNYLVHRREKTPRQVVTALVEFVENRDWDAVLKAQGRGEL